MIGLEHLGDGSIGDRNFQKLASLVLDTGGVTAGIRFGSTTVSTTAAVFGSNTVTHGLGKTPTCVLATAFSTSGVVNATVGNVGDTTIDVFVRYTDDVARTASNTVYWAVIG